MNGNDRRRMELLHPESALTSKEREEKEEIAMTVAIIGNGISLLFMLFGMVLVAYVSTRYMGVIGFWIAFLGILLDVIIGALIGLNFGNKMTQRYTEKIIYNNNHNMK